MITDRPCGACRALVDSWEGCQHWSPGRDDRKAEANRRKRENLAAKRRNRKAQAERVLRGGAK